MQNRRVLKALETAIELCPNIEIGKFFRYITSYDELGFLEDKDIAIHIEYYNRMASDPNFGSFYKYQCAATDYDYTDYYFIYDDHPFIEQCYSFTKENEQIAYERYQQHREGHIYCPLEERLDCSDFLKRFSIYYVDADDYKGTLVINHKSDFLNCFPPAYRHMNAYTIYKKEEQYTAHHRYVVKNPCFGEMFVETCGLDRFQKGEILSIAIDWVESPRFTDYTRHIMYGVIYRPEQNEIEIYDTDQAVTLFHDWMQKCTEFIIDWDNI